MNTGWGIIPAGALDAGAGRWDAEARVVDTWVGRLRRYIANNTRMRVSVGRQSTRTIGYRAVDCEKRNRMDLRGGRKTNLVIPSSDIVIPSFTGTLKIQPYRVSDLDLRHRNRDVRRFLPE